MKLSKIINKNFSINLTHVDYNRSLRREDKTKTEPRRINYESIFHQLNVLETVINHVSYLILIGSPF